VESGFAIALVSFMPAKSTHQENLIPADWAIGQLPGLTEQDASRLANLGIQTTRQLWQQAHSSARRHWLSAQLKLHPKYVNKWAALANLAQIPSVGCQYCGLLLHTGISSPSQLAQTPLDRLHRQVLRFYVTNLQRRDLCPSREDLAQWIQQAQALIRRTTPCTHSLEVTE